MDIKFKELSREEGQSAQGKTWVGYKIIGTKLADGNEWESGLIFDNKYNRDVLEAARGLAQGDKVGVQLKQNGKFWNVVGIGAPKDPAPARVTPTKTAGGGSSGGMSKEEWAEKNKKDAESIARAVALKAAVENTKVGATPKDVIAMAIEFVPFLLGNDQAQVGGLDDLDIPEV